MVRDNYYWVVDVEGSGSSPPEIVELAMLEIADFEPTGNRLHWLVRPEQPIQAVASNIHGITDVDVADAPSMEDIADDVEMWLNSTPIVGHNVRVELDILSRSLPNWAPGAAIDTLKVAKLLKPGMKSYGLENLGKSFGYAEMAGKETGLGHHSALYDATLTSLIFIGLLLPLPEERRAEVLQEADILNPSQHSLL